MSRLSILLTLLAPFVMADTSAPSSLPQVDFGRMGSVGMGGSFDGLDWWSDSSPFSSTSTSTSSFSSTGATVFVRDSSGSVRVLGSTNAGGEVRALCWASTASSSNATLYIGGSFTSLSGVSSANIISYSLADSSFAAISPGLSGPVNTLYCDNDNSQVWVGGAFSAVSGSSGGGNVALWSTTSSSWSTVPFSGLNGPVESITPSSNGSSFYFGGHFTTSYFSTNSTNSTTLGNITSIPSAPANTSTTGNSGYLTPVTIPQSTSNSGSLKVVAGPSTTQKAYSDPNVLLCPGEGVWLAQDNTVSDVDVMGYTFLRAWGARVTNGLIQGRGATSFCITSLPDNTQLNMTYTDPATGKNATCWEHCPLSTDSTIAAQDFIFTSGPRNLTGLQMQLKTWIGDGAGLSSVELLSDGAYGSAIPGNNEGACKSQNSSIVQQTGDWTVDTVTTSIPATTSYYLTSTVPVSNPTYPSVTFYPYVSSAGTYEVYIIIPSCQSTGDCDSRTSVDIEVFPVQGGLGWTSTISEQVEEDTRTLVYSGPIDMSDGSFTPTISLALARSPDKPKSGDSYTIVADAVQLVLTDVSGGQSRSTGSGGNSTSTSSSTKQSNSTNTAFGVFEWARASSNIDAAASSLSNTTETALSKLGLSLGSAYNASGSPSDWTVNAVASLNGIVYVAGDFTQSGNYSNVVAIDTASGQATLLDAQGLSGKVFAAVAVGNYVYIGGAFTGTAAGGTSLGYLARYDPKGKSWAGLAGGVDGPVTDLQASGSTLVVAGNFSHTLASDGTSMQTGGYATYDTDKSTWSSGSGAVFGNLTASALHSDTIFLAGRVTGVSSNPVSGVAMLGTDDNGQASISTLGNVNFGTTGSAAASPSSRRRSFHARSSGSLTRNFLSRFTDVIVERAAPKIAGRATAPTIPAVSAPAPAVLAGAFWTNTSASGKPAITVLGGNFSSSNIEGLAFYNPSLSSLSGPSPPVQGVVRTVAVIGNDVYLGGSSVNVSGVGSGLLVYNLQTSSWLTGGMPSLNPTSGSSLVVNAIRQRTDTNTVVVAGNFDTAGSLSCAAMCLWDAKNQQWSAPGSGLEAGEVRALDLAGDAYDTVIAAGSFVLPGGDVAYVASFSFGNSSWTAFDGLPGPALAVAVDDKNASNIFASGYSSSDSTPYLQQWNGAVWTAQNASLLSGSLVQQLAFVPMRQEHTPAGSIEKDRMLLVSGQLVLRDEGNATSALYDGQNWYPYLVGSSSSGGLGSASQLFWSESSFSFAVRHFLAKGLVVLVAIAIATGLILLLILLFLLISYLTRKRERKRASPMHLNEKDNADGAGSDISSTHQHVFNSVQAALQQSLGGAALGAGAAAAAPRQPPRDSGVSEYDTPVIGAGGGYTSDEESEEEEGRETTMRYDFDGPELQPGEMSMKAGQKIVIIDDVQSEEWWYAKDPATGREGVVPATYVW